ncbi:MAG: penicillin-binding protein 2 [Candidatus Omnitrophica bacterium]|nr:penicillin-binding protein 2 [Candidatus Omnitrophota bacterium]MDD5429702.1 penicillin-binding protein 2 [Candidatus Omnitrophota bacterium]
MKKYWKEKQNGRRSFPSSGLMILYFGGFLFLTVVLFFYQGINGKYYFQRAKNNYVKVIPLFSIRGSIFDKNGVLLAYDKAAFNLSVIPYQIRDTKDSLFKEISKSLGRDTAEIYRNYSRNFLNYFSPVNIVLDIDKRAALDIQEKLGSKVLINPQPQRHYPYSYEFSHVIGYVKKVSSFYEELKQYGYSPLERAGFSGIEQYYDSYLQGESGGRLIEVDAGGRVVGFLGQLISKKGKDIRLSIDSRIQREAYRSLSGKKGVIILINSANGQILALCSLPSFDANNFIKGKGLSRLFDDPACPLINRAIQSTYPLGSVFKPIEAAGALEEGLITPHTTFVCDGQFKLGSAVFRCSHIHGPQDLYQALAHSCNIYFYNLSLISGSDFLSRWAKNFGLDSLTGVDLAFEKKGFIPTRKWKEKKLETPWYAGDTLNFSIGQGFINSTPIEILTAMNVFASQGYIIIPHLLEEVGGIPSGISSKTYIGVSQNNLDAIRSGLRKAVAEDSGTAHILERLGIKMAGKTGTAQNRGASHAWFAGYFNSQGNDYTICVFLENGGSSYEAVKITYKFLKKILEGKLI